jgi:hypothetical protein
MKKRAGDASLGITSSEKQKIMLEAARITPIFNT